MRRISILACILVVCFASTVWAQQPATKPPMGRHVPHRMTNQASRTPGVTVSRGFSAQANPDHKAKVWELGTYYPGGTWVSSEHINDLGVIVGRGDVPDSNGVLSNHTLIVPLFGPHAGEWYDLGTLGGAEPTGGEEPDGDISDTGMVVSRSTSSEDGYEHAVAWTRETGLVDLGTLAATGDPKYAIYKVSYAHSTNKLGTLIAGSGWSPEASKGWPAVWTPSFKWKDGKFVTKWKIQALDLSAYPELTGGVAWRVNDYGQIVGGGYNDDFTIFKALLWTPRAHGKGWEVNALPTSSGYPIAQAYGINDKGEIVGAANSADFGVYLPRVWKPTDWKRTTYSKPIELPVPEGFTYCETVGINEMGDMVGDCWDDPYTMDLPVRWSTKHLTNVEMIDFPAAWGFAWGVNDFGIATVTYLTDPSGNCSWDTYGSCVGAIQLH